MEIKNASKIQIYISWRLYKENVFAEFLEPQSSAKRWLNTNKIQASKL
jgi:hypothetical protein